LCLVVVLVVHVAAVASLRLVHVFHDCCLLALEPGQGHAQKAADRSCRQREQRLGSQRPDGHGALPRGRQLGETISRRRSSLDS
jgi:hypothetical protein